VQGEREDHFGARPYLWQRLRCPIYAAPFTAGLARDKLARGGCDDAPIVEVGLDDRPLVGETYDRRLLHGVRRGPLLAMASGSTSAVVDGSTGSEGNARRGALSHVYERDGWSTCEGVLGRRARPGRAAAGNAYAPRGGRGAGAHPLQRYQPRYRVHRLSRRRPRERVPPHALSLPGREFSGAGEVRLHQRRTGGGGALGVAGSGRLLSPSPPEPLPGARGGGPPVAVPLERAVLAANMETAVNGLWDAAPRLGDRIAVIGAGTLGCLVARLASRIPGCAMELIDINPARAGIAARLGVESRNPQTATREADLVVHTSGSPAGLVTALEIAGFESTVLEMSWYGDQKVALPLGEDFHQRRLTLRSSQVGKVATAQRPRWDHGRRMALALSLLSDPVLDGLITGEDAFEDLPEVQARLAKAPGDTICHRIRYA